MRVTRVAPGLYRVDDGSRVWNVAIAGPPDNRWVWVDGHVAKLPSPSSNRTRSRATSHDLSPPMPATVVKLMVEAGARVNRGDTLLVLEAMKMELPVRAPNNGVVQAVNCEVGELVQPGQQLIEFESDAS